MHGIMDYILQTIALLKTHRREWEGEYYRVLEECGHEGERMNSAEVKYYVDEISAINSEIHSLEQVLEANYVKCPG